MSVSAASPYLSIVTISLDQGKFLASAVESVLTQGERVEYVVVDPGSTDGSRDYLASIADSFSRLILEPDAGPADGLNKGVASCTGEVVGCINADDFYLPGALDFVSRVFQERPEVDVITGHGYIVDEHARRMKTFRSTSFSPTLYARGSTWIMQQATFYRRSSFERAGGFNIANPVSWDIELLIDMALTGAHIERVDAYLGAFRFHPASITVSGRYQRHAALEDRRLMEKCLGRKPGPSDFLLQRLGRTRKWVRHPSDTAIRVSDALGGALRSRRPQIGR